MKYTQLKEMLSHVTHPGSEVVLYRQNHDTVFYRVKEWLEKIGYQVKHQTTKPTDIIIAMSPNVQKTSGGILFDLFEQNTDPHSGGGESYAYNTTGDYHQRGKWYRSNIWNGECPWESEAFEYMPDIMPELAELFTSDKAEMIYFGANTDFADNKYPFVRLCDRILTATQSGKTVFLCNTDESVRDCGFWKATRALDFLGDQIPAHSVFYVTSGLDVPEACLTSRLEILCVARFDRISSGASRDGDIEFTEFDTKSTRSKDFLLFNRMPRPHRLSLLDQLVERGLHQRGYISFDPDNLSLTSENYPNLAKLTDTFPWVINRTPERDNPVFLDNDDMQYYHSSYFSVIPETSYYTHDSGNGPNSSMFHSRFLSEKTFKSIVAKHPFLMVGQHQILQSIKDLGYKTFHPWIDESYDQIEDDEDRMLAIVQEIHRLCEQTPEQWAEWLQGVSEAVEFNHKYNMQHRSLAMKDNDAYKKLLNRVKHGS